MGITDSSLKYHLQSAKNNGITRTEIAQMLTHIGFYAGWPKAWAAFHLAKEVWNEDVQGNEDEKAAFEPACRNNWHIHHAKKGGGQVLICVAGTGWYQEWNKPAQKLNAGDVVNIPAGVKHWHGAAADSWFAHLAVEVPGEETRNEWLEAVNDEVYKQL